MTVETKVNGLNVGDLQSAIKTMKAEPAMAQFTFRAHNEWIDGAHCRTEIEGLRGGGEEKRHKRKFVLDGDEPEALLGTDTGPNATEAALHALGACLNTTFIFHAAALGVKIEKLEVELEGDVDLRGFLAISRQVRNGYSNVRVTFRVKSDAPRQTLEKLCELAQQHSPVFDIVTHPTPVTAKLEVML